MVEPNDLPGLFWTPVRMSSGVPTLEVMSLTVPLQHETARRISVSPAVDLFHPLLPDIELDRVFAVMLACVIGQLPHRFTLVTAYAGRMHDYLRQDQTELVGRWARAGDRDVRHECFPAQFSIEVARATSPRWSLSKVHEVRPYEALEGVFPLPNLAVGVSATTQSEVDERVPRLIDAPVAHRFVQATPRERLDLSYPVLADRLGYYPFSLSHEHRTQRLHMLDWLSVGGPHGVDPWHVESDWVDSLMSDCSKAKVPFLFRDWGSLMGKAGSSDTSSPAKALANS